MLVPAILPKIILNYFIHNRDGLHLSPSGNEVVFNAVMDVIKAKLPQLDPERLPLDFPIHRDVDSDDPVPYFRKWIQARELRN
jgi:hypothetical protein